MKIIDFERKGNVVRFYFGADDLTEWWGDDWDDVPYEHNAGRVYDEYVSGHKDVSFPFDSLVLEPCDGYLNSDYSKEDMVKRLVPCIVVVPKEIYKNSCNIYNDSFGYWVGANGIKKFYFGDEIKEEDNAIN